MPEVLSSKHRGDRVATDKTICFFEEKYLPYS